MSKFEILNFEELKKELDKHKFKQLHIHHTWKPTHRSFKGNNHIQMQQSMYNYHVNTNKWSDIGQHLTLFPDGKWVTGRPFNIAPASIKNWNTGALAVEMVGNFDKLGTLPFNELGYDELEGEQKKQILLLMKYFIDKYGESSIKFHREGQGVAKTCPGTSLNKYAMINEAKELGKVKEVIKMGSVFKDVDDNRWSAKDIERAAKLGIIVGTDKGEFNPTGNLTREQAAVIAMRIIDHIKGGK